MRIYGAVDSRPARVRKAALTDWLRASLVAARGGERRGATEGKVVESLAERRRVGRSEAARRFTRGRRGSREDRRGGGLPGPTLKALVIDRRVVYLVPIKQEQGGGNGFYGLS